MKKIKFTQLSTLFCALTLLLATECCIAQSPQVVVVSEATVKVYPLAVEALGNALAFEAVEIRPEITATLTAIRFMEGQFVEAGFILAELENVEPLADLAAARATLADSESQYNRSVELFKSQLTSESQVQQLEARREAGRAAVAAAQARVEDTVIKAPFAGLLGLRQISVGSQVNPSTVITTLDDTTRIKLDFDIPEIFLSRIQVGLSVTARSAAWPDMEFRGIVASINSRVDPVSRTVTVRSIIPNPEGQLRAGMFLTVTLLKQDVVSLMIPEQALMPERSTQSVLVVDDNNVVEQRLVLTGRRRPGEVEILEGLAEGERVIIEGTQKARNGQQVRIIETRDSNP